MLAPVRRVTGIALLIVLLTACAGPTGRQAVRFVNATPDAPMTIDATLVRPSGSGPFPAIVQLHGC
ncbi:MAG TPA: hypothetical protein VF578_17525, partial [Methylomirabilota bacterium]